jgi:hypothetical protein
MLIYFTEEEITELIHCIAEAEDEHGDTKEREELYRKLSLYLSENNEESTEKASH